MDASVIEGVIFRKKTQYPWTPLYEERLCSAARNAALLILLNPEARSRGEGQELHQFAV